jgi:UDP-N-acetylmuramoylalanine--D-glutamate ligase
MIELEGRSVLVVGLGDSGVAASRLAAGAGALVTAIDASTSPAKLDRVEDLQGLGIDVRIGVDVPGDLGGFDLLVASPGVPERAQVITRAKAEGVPVESELEFAFAFLKNRMVAVTGTNGKTTTTRLIARMLDRPETKAHACGNIGTPLSSMYGRVQGEDILVVEVSSFQLANIDRFRADVSVSLNMAPDHFDWHRDMQEYRAAKLRLVENMLPGDYLVYNRSDEFCRLMAEGARGIKVSFSAIDALEEGVRVEDGWVVTGPPLDNYRLFEVADVRVPGRHNLEDIMAASAASLAMRAEPDDVAIIARDFSGIPHRMELVSSVKGVDFYNDSKATNPHASLSALKALDKPSVLILGGRNKGLDLGELTEEVCMRLGNGRLRGVVLMGEAAAEIESTLTSECADKVTGRVEHVENMDECVERSFWMAGRRGSVILSPACASFDMYDDYRDRGRAFTEAVAKLAKRVEDGEI